MRSGRSYIKVVSWHLLARVDAAGWRTVCGRLVTGEAPVSDTLPMDEKSCETCARIALHREDEASGAENEVSA